MALSAGAKQHFIAVDVHQHQRLHLTRSYAENIKITNRASTVLILNNLRVGFGKCEVLFYCRGKKYAHFKVNIKHLSLVSEQKKLLLWDRLKKPMLPITIPKKKILSKTILPVDRDQERPAETDLKRFKAAKGKFSQLR